MTTLAERVEAGLDMYGMGYLPGRVATRVAVPKVTYGPVKDEFWVWGATGMRLAVIHEGLPSKKCQA